ncbi:hypothetical protein QR90_09720 [Deinococcus radiopugnans]|uniref:SpoVT-AbrB domain-containing protein n=1 Tax=Deinococcus radiopugnans TaxID=57497 RepID=A0A0A7KGM6_9DEIO|nr:AbrB/MazE/SpoVT family DNA-binding domain-containing protein [Deinococcus radiopugnans]AIZ45317.1 hypothetical protein QR90_09720 [Deinococcus radiopugnans]
MKGQIQKWGNSLALRIPKRMAEEAGVGQGMPVSVELTEGRIIITPIRATHPTLDELLAQIRPDNLHGEEDWGGPQGREEW